MSIQFLTTRILFSTACSRPGSIYRGITGLETEIAESDLPLLAEYFDNVRSCADVMKLNRAEICDVIREMSSKGTHDAMRLCLQLWRRRNPSTATFKALLQIVMTLKRRDIADDIVDYFLSKHRYTCLNNDHGMILSACKIII